MSVPCQSALHYGLILHYQLIYFCLLCLVSAVPLLRFISRSDAHHRLLTALGIATLSGFIIPSTLSGPARLTIGWVVFALVNLLMMWTTILLVHPRELPGLSQIEDSSRTLIFAVVLTAAMASLLAVVALLGGMEDSERRADMILAGSAVASAWTLIHTLFALRYAHLYYGNDSRKPPAGLDFPHEPEPDYLDFAYFSFIIGMTSQTADVSIESKSIRRTALTHGVLSFIFNVVIIAFTISGLSSLL